MTPTEITAAPVSMLVDRGLVITRELARLQAELKQINAALVRHALSAPHEHESLVDAERDGRRWMASGSLECIPVVITADKIISSFQDCSQKHKDLVALIGEPRLPFYFSRKVTWERREQDGKAYRAALADMLPADLAAAMVTATLARDKNGNPKSDIYPDWTAAEEVRG